MDETQIFDMTRQALWIAVRMSAPLLIVALVAGVAIGLFQALTQIQDQTLPHAVKLVAAGAVLLLVGGGLASQLVRFADDVFSRIAGI